MKKIYLTVSSIIIFILSANSQIVAWQFGNPASLGDEIAYSTTTSNINIVASNLTRGVGINVSALARGFSANSFDVGATKIDAINNNEYFAFSITPNSGYKAYLSTLDVRLRRSGTTAPNMFIWRYSFDGINFFDIGTDIAFTSTADGVNQTQINLTAIPGLQNVTSSIYFRLYTWGGTSTTATFAIGRYNAGITDNSLELCGAIIPIANPNSSITDYFRSIQDGNWSNPGTWQSSPDNASWNAATLAPSSLSNNINIRNGDTVTIVSNTSADQLVINNGGTLVQNNTPTFTIDDGLGVDMVINTDGRFIMNGRQPVGLGSVSVAGGGHVEIASNPAPSEGDDFAYGANAVASVVFLNDSFFDWNTNAAPQWSGRTFFTTGNSTFFRFLVAPTLGVGGGSPTIINGVLQADVPLTIINAGTKTFVNGIINDGTITATSSGGLIINGGAAQLGGNANIILPTAGLTVGNGTVAYTVVSANKTLTGDVSFLPNGYISIYDFDLTVTGAITGTSSTSYFITFGLSETGKLIRPSIGATPIEFAVGHLIGSYNPVTISNGDNASYGVKVMNQIYPTSVFNDNNLVNRTWIVKPNATPVNPVNIVFNYETGHANAGFNYTANLELGLYTSVWNVIQTGIVPTGTYSAATPINSFGANIDAPLVLGNLGAILSQSVKINLAVKQLNTSNELTWQTTGFTNAKSYLIEKSLNGVNFVILSTISNLSNKYVDANLINGNVYYRLKCVLQNNTVVYSNVVVVKNSSINVQLAPTIANTNITLTINAVSNQKINIIVTDVLGRSITMLSNSIKIGENKLNLPLYNFAKGMYHVSIQFENGDIITRKFIKD
jgi:hypothetical protein